MPVGDIQFWIVTFLALVGMFSVIRQFRPTKKKQTKTELTISAKKRDS